MKSNRLFPWSDTSVDGMLAREKENSESRFSRVKYTCDPLLMKRSHFASDCDFHVWRLFFLHWQRIFAELGIDVDWDLQRAGNSSRQCVGLRMHFRRLSSGFGQPEVVDLSSGRAIFVTHSVMQIGNVQIKSGYLYQANTDAEDARRGDLVTGASGTVFLPGIFGNKVGENHIEVLYKEIPAITARLLMRGVEISYVKALCDERGLERLIEVAIESERAQDTVQSASYLGGTEYAIVRDLGVLDIEHFAFYPIAGVSGMSRRMVKERLRMEMLKSLQHFRDRGIKGEGLSREDIANTIVGIICMYEPRTGGSIVVQFPATTDDVPRVTFEDGLGRQKRIETAITRFITAAKVTGVNQYGSSARMSFSLWTGCMGTAVEKAFYIGLAAERLRTAGVSVSGLPEAA